MATRRDEKFTIIRRAEEVLIRFKQRERVKAGYTRIDPDLIARGANVLVLYRQLEKLLGAFIREKATNGIIINAARPRGMLHMTCAHELGHFFLGHESTTDETVEEPNVNVAIERAANLFAYHLLTPKWLVADLMRKKKVSANQLQDPSVVYQMSLRVGISYTAMVWQLHRLELLNVTAAGALATITPATLKRRALGGIQTADGMSDVWVVDRSDREQILEPGIGDQFVFELPNHLGGGHAWSVDEAASNGFQLRPFLQESGSTPPIIDGKAIVGSGPSTIKYGLSFPANSGNSAAGNFNSRLLRHVIALQERRPWDMEEDAIDQLRLETKQEAIRNGYSRVEAGARLNKAN
jgi:Zn-dependent peptidase ImmA (M78 family)